MLVDMKTFEYRLYPTDCQRDLLMGCLIESRGIYNRMLEANCTYYKDTNKFLSRYDLNKKFAGIKRVYTPASTVQCLADRLDKAFARCFGMRSLGFDCGFPRFKKANQWRSIHLRQAGGGHDFCMSGKRLRVSKLLGGPIKIKLHRPLEGAPKTCYLVLRADNHWYALIVCDNVPKPEPVEKKETIGIDVGLKVFLADSEGNTVENPRYYRKSEKKLRVCQRRGSRRVQGSHRRKKANRLTAKRHLKVARQRKDFHFKVAKRYVDRYWLIAVEKLNIEGMVKNHCFAKSIHDAGWGQFISILTQKAESAGGVVVAINPAYTSQMCFKCKELVQKSLSVRTHVCPHCGYVEDRDVNAAKNILAKGSAQWAGAQPSDVKLDVGLVSPRNRKLLETIA